MKKLSFVLLVLVLFGTVSAFAANSSSTTITATIPPMASVTSDLPPSAPIDINGSSTLIGTMTFATNTTGTWNIVIHSQNQGVMKGDANSGNHYPYTMTVLLTFPSSETLLNKASLDTDKSATYTGGGPFSLALVADYLPATSIAPLLPPDTYRDVITVSVSSL